MMDCAASLAMVRIQRLAATPKTDESILYSSGPDVISECAYGVRDRDYQGQQVGTADVLIVDPGPLLMNGNSFTWRNNPKATAQV